MLKFLQLVWLTIHMAALSVILGTIMMGHFRASGPSDSTAPTISTVVEVAQGYDPILFKGRGLALKATFSEDMDSGDGGLTRIAVTFGASTKYCTFTSWLSATEALYVYTLDGSENDEDGLAVVSPIDLNGGHLRDLAGNEATLTFSAPDLSAFRVVFRGASWMCDFTQPTDAQTIEPKFLGVTVGTGTGILGDTTGTDANDPSFQNYGMFFDANKVVKNIGTNGQFDRICNTSLGWCVHFRARIDISVSGKWAILFSCADPAVSGLGVYIHGYTSGGNLGLTFNSNGGAFNWNAGLTGAQWATFSFSCDGAGNVSCWVNGALISAQSVTGTAANKKGRIQQLEGYEAVGYIGGMPMKMRAAVFCAVTPSSAEVAAAHTVLAALANAA